ncbi:MAG: sigma-70 family RNA polymerase sigma factor [Myxococcota bacterium]
MERVLAGDKHASRQLFVRVAPIFARMARTTLGPGSPEIDDFIQDASLQFFRALASFRGESRLTWFAFRIAQHTATAWIRNQRALKRSNEQVGLPDAVADRRASAARLEQRELFEELVATLNEAQLEALLMRAVMGYSVEEIAEALRVPVNTVRSRLRRAKHSLRERVAHRPDLSEGLRQS